MSVAITGDGPNIALTGSGSSFTITVTTGSAAEVQSVNGETGVVVLSADDVNARDVYRPAIVMSPATVTAFGGSMVNGVSVTLAALASAVPVGADLLIWNGTAGAAPNGSYTHAGSGTFNYSARQYLTATSVANGCGLVESVDFYTAGSAADSSLWKLATVNGTDWGLVAIGGYAFKVGLNLDQYATDADITTLEGVDASLLQQIQNLVADLQSQILAIATVDEPTPAAWFVFDNDSNPNQAWSTSDIPELSAEPDMRALVFIERGTQQFNEIWTRTFDGLGTIDSPEMAANFDSDGRLYLFGELVPGGETLESENRLNAPLATEGMWAWLRVYPDFANTRWVGQVAVRYGGDETADGRLWLTIGTQDAPDIDSIEWNITEPWWLGLRFFGRIARGELYDGIDGTLVAAPDATDWSTGTSFTDSEGIVWSTTTGTVGTP